MNKLLAVLGATAFLTGMYAFWPSEPSPKAVMIPSAKVLAGQPAVTYTTADCDTAARYAAMRSGVACSTPLPPERPAVPVRKPTPTKKVAPVKVAPVAAPAPVPVAPPVTDYYQGPGAANFE